MKRMPLLILGKRQSGKSTALVGFAKTINNIIGIAPSLVRADMLFKPANIKCISSHNIIQQKIRPETKWIIDEFCHCNSIPEDGQIIALNDDINNFEKVMRKLKQLGYPINIKYEVTKMKIQSLIRSKFTLLLFQ